MHTYNYQLMYNQTQSNVFHTYMLTKFIRTFSLWNKLAGMTVKRHQKEDLFFHKLKKDVPFIVFFIIHIVVVINACFTYFQVFME